MIEASKTLPRQTAELELHKLSKTAKLIRSLTHPVRLEILRYLGEKSNKSVTDIHTDLKLDQPVASHHLAVLRNNEVLVAERDGKNVYYSINSKKLEALIACLEMCN